MFYLLILEFKTLSSDCMAVTCCESLSTTASRGFASSDRFFLTTGSLKTDDNKVKRKRSTHLLLILPVSRASDEDQPPHRPEMIRKLLTSEACRLVKLWDLSEKRMCGGKHATRDLFSCLWSQHHNYGVCRAANILLIGVLVNACVSWQEIVHWNFICFKGFSLFVFKLSNIIQV